ncbi:MAG: hypothetical protein ACREIC_13675 [Limisphaerales bacterium]
MKQELDRVKNDLETIQKAMGLAPSMGRDWIQWMKRDNWLNLWWCLPGVILIASGLLPFSNKERYLGLALAQWTGLLVAAVMLVITVFYFRKMTGKDGRPNSLIREYKRINGLNVQGAWLNLALLTGLGLYFLWGKLYGLTFGAFWSGLFIFMGSSCLVTAIASRAWLLLGWAVPFLAYGLFQTLLPGSGKVSGIPLGVMFIAVALSFSVIQVWQIRKIERQHESH